MGMSHRNPLRKVYHLAAMVNQRGGVSPLCARKPRAINLHRAMWTIRREAVTCAKCLKLLEGTTISHSLLTRN